VTITSEVADVVSKIWAGPTTPSGTRLWYGINKGAPFETLANTTNLPNGATIGVPDFFAVSWAAYFLKRDPNFDYTTVGYDQFLDFYIQSNDEYEWVIGTRDPDLSLFRDMGGKMLTWHGLADPLIMTNNTINYRERVNDLFGGNAAVDEFWRLFLAPGVNHCGGGLGAVPPDPLAAVVAWVEQGVAPETLPASTVANGTTVEHDLCLYPLTSKYVGGDPAAAASYTCVPV
jgi:Tannase and feruloyl esterase